MKTNGGYKVVNFKKLEKEIKRGILESHIYEGIVDVPNFYGETNQKVTWDRFGRVSNPNRWHDCSIDVSDFS